MLPIYKALLAIALRCQTFYWGYGFPIGGVAAMDAETGVISPGGVGKDLNERARRSLLEYIFHLVPSGVGHGHKGGKRDVSQNDYRELVQKGAA